jgi:hypothetical protein
MQGLCGVKAFVVQRSRSTVVAVASLALLHVRVGHRDDQAGRTQATRAGTSDLRPINIIRTRWTTNFTARVNPLASLAPLCTLETPNVANAFRHSNLRIQ